MDPFDELALLKGCFRTAANEVKCEATPSQTITTKEKSGCTLQAIRAVEKGDILAFQIAYPRYPHLASLCDMSSYAHLEAMDLEGMRDHAVELARASAQEQLEALSTSKKT